MQFPVTDKFLCVCPFVLFCFCGFSFLFNLCVIKLSTLQSRVQPSTNEPDIIFAYTFCILNKNVWTMVVRELSTAKSGVLADVIGLILFRLLQSWCLWQSYFRLLQDVCYSVSWLSVPHFRLLLGVSDLQFHHNYSCYRVSQPM